MPHWQILALVKTVEKLYVPESRRTWKLTELVTVPNQEKWVEVFKQFSSTGVNIKQKIRNRTGKEKKYLGTIS